MDDVKVVVGERNALGRIVNSERAIVRDTMIPLHRSEVQSLLG